MNQNQIQQLTSQLSQALDPNYDVINMEAVLAVICTLEGTTITKEQLEATRLAKYINQLRRRTKNDQLARRAKSLLKKWREMVGINQTSSDSQTAITTTTATINKPINESIIIADNVLNPQPSVSVTTSASASSSTFMPEAPNFSLNHLDNSVDFSSFKPKSDIDKLNEPPIVIDIVSDSDENENEARIQSNTNRSSSASASSQQQQQAFPAFYPRPKKLKKDKKSRKEREKLATTTAANLLTNLKEDLPLQMPRAINRNNLAQQQPQQLGRKIYPTDTEILSLSNSSMSSILSGDNTLNNNRYRSNAADLTFAGRFKSLTQFEDNNNPPPLSVNGQKKLELEQPQQLYEDYMLHNDSSNSVSRLSPFEEQSIPISHDEGSNKQMPAVSKPQEYQRSENILSQVPKKRGRKKGSKGVDSLIAKESSSLSQQIFFNSGVKKVKTTKELFNDIQSRKLSISYRGDSALPASASVSGAASKLSNRDARPTSSCSETSLHSPHTLEAFSTNASQTGNDKFSTTLEASVHTDSETITSAEPSRRHSLDDSNSNNSQQTISATSRLMNTECDADAETTTDLPLSRMSLNHSAGGNYSDVSKQLMQLMRSLNAPLSVSETERLYRSQIVPCTCIILEDAPKLNAINDENGNNTNSNELNSESVEDQRERRQQQQTESINRNIDSQQMKLSAAADVDETTITPVSIAPSKPIKSIFDLDFDDDDDPMQSIMQTMPDRNEPNTNEPNELKSTTTNVQNEVNNLHAVIDSKTEPDPTGDNNQTELVPLSIYTVHEDPDCLARQRFDIQTNKVTSFHINALHNYYVPNINGNWNTTGNDVNWNSSINDQTYSVRDGSDVVPKYGSLTYELIRKDLSELKIKWSVKRDGKKLKNYMPTFLGVAKCLPTCRRRAARERNEIALKRETSRRQIKSSPSPLRVHIDNANDNNVIDDQVDASIGYNLLKLAQEADAKLSYVADELSITNRTSNRCNSSSNNSDCSNFSLQQSQNSINAKLRNRRTSEQATERHVIERNRKKRRKANRNEQRLQLSLNEKPRIKRIKIAINGQLPHISNNSSSSCNNSSEEQEEPDQNEQQQTEENEQQQEEQYEQGEPQREYQNEQQQPEEEHETRSELSDDYQRMLLAASDASDEEDDDDEHASLRSRSTTLDEDAIVLEHEYDNDNDNDNNNASNDNEYAIIRRGGNNGNNHLVLTIKKTPSKINSPVNSISTNISPNIVAAAVKTQNDNDNSEGVQKKQQQTMQQQQATMTSTSPSCLHNVERCYRYRRRHHRHRHRYRRPPIIDITLKHLFNNNNNNNNNNNSVKQLHRKLFFTNELKFKNDAGQKERILNYSSSSSSSGSGSSSDDNSELETDKELEATAAHNYKLKYETDKSVRIAANKHTDDENDEQLSLNTEEDEEEEVDDESDDEAAAAAAAEGEAGAEAAAATEDGAEAEVEPASEGRAATEVKAAAAELDAANNVRENVNEYLTTLAKLRIDNNNGMLPTFNAIYAKQTQQQRSNQTCDEHNNNLSPSKCGVMQQTTLAPTTSNMLEASCERRLPPALENITGMRTVLLDVDVNVEEQAEAEQLKTDKKRLQEQQQQQFKEWHQVLQLQSYNDEPLIVLPYVVLE